MINALVVLVIVLLAVGLLIALVFYVVDAVPVPDPFGRFIKIAVVTVCCLVVILLLLNVAGMGGGALTIPKVVG